MNEPDKQIYKSIVGNPLKINLNINIDNKPITFDLYESNIDPILSNKILKVLTSIFHENEKSKTFNYYSFS